MGRLGRSWQLMKTSLHILREDKAILLLPIISFIASVAVIGTFVAGFFFSGMIFTLTWPLVLGFFIMYLLLYFLIIFFNTAVIACADIRLNGGEPTLSEGLRIAGQNLGRILAWSLISATIGIILQAARERSGILGRILIAVVGIAWTAITFFISPVLIYEKKGMLSSIRRSGSLFRQTWGETLAGMLGFGIIFFLLALVGLIPIIIGALIGGFYPFIIGFVLAILYWVILGAVASATNGIYVAALYQYATKGRLPEPYDPSLVPSRAPNVQ